MSARSRLTARLKVKVVPGASTTGIAGWLGDELKVRVSVPAEKGKANAAVERLVAGALGLAPSATRIVAGAGSPRKVMIVSGISQDELRRRLLQLEGNARSKSLTGDN